MSRESAIATAADYTPVVTATPPAVTTPAPQPSVKAPIEGGAPIVPVVDTVPKDPAFERLAKKESELQTLRDQIKRDREATDAERKRISEAADKLKRLEGLEKYEQIADLKQKDVVAAMRLAGFTDQDIASYYQEVSKVLPPEEIARSAAQKVLDDAKAVSDKAAQDAQLKAQTEAVTTFKGDISKGVAAEPDKYEFCNRVGAAAEELIFDTVSAVYQEELKTNPAAVIMPISEAIELVEQYYEEQYEEMSTFKKAMAKRTAQDPATTPDKPSVTTPQPEQTTPRVQITPAPDGRRPTTITNRLTPTISSTPAPKHETPEQKKERLVNKWLRATAAN